MGLILVLGVGVWLYGAVPEKVSDTLKRTQQYTKLVGGVQTAQDRLNTFIEGEQKACQAKGNSLQLSPQGLLACVETPKPASPATGNPSTPNTPPSKK